MLTRTVLREGQALARENGAALEVVRNVREVRLICLCWINTFFVSCACLCGFGVHDIDPLHLEQVKSFAAEGKEAARYSERLEATRGLSAGALHKYITVYLI